MMQRWKESDMQRVALITGGSRGLGLTLASFLSPQGIDLVLTGRDEVALNTAARDLARFGGRVVAVAGNVADGAHRRALAKTVAELGRLDWLVNNASILGPSPQPPLARYPLETLEQVYAVNVLGPLGLVQELASFLAASRGLVINVTSDAAVGGYPGWGGYGSSKAALELLSLTLANELRDQGVGVVSVDPGDMRTQMHQEAFPGEDISDRPLPEATLPFWAWLFGQAPLTVSGQRFQAQAESWLTDDKTSSTPQEVQRVA